MHAVLQTPELRDAIISNVGDNPKDLLSVALTCRWFCEPALLLMWREVCQYRPAVTVDDLLYLLPDSKVGRSDHGGPLCQADLTANDIERLRYYSAFTRWLSLDDFRNGILDVPSLSRIVAALGGQPLFPKLQELFCGFAPALPDHMSAIVSPSVRWLHMDVPELDKDVLDTLTRRTPSLESLYFDVHDPRFRSDWLRSCLAGWQHLTTLSIALPNWDTECVLAISAMPALASLSILRSFMQDEDQHRLNVRIPEVTHGNGRLDRLHISHALGDGLGDPMDILSVVHPTVLSAFSADSIHSARSAKLASSRLLSICGPALLTDVRLEGHEGGGGGSARLGDIKSLLQMRNL
ncbi:hypothetical protein EV121DRAFT_274926, partial [Schizophyllum commune]